MYEFHRLNGMLHDVFSLASPEFLQRDWHLSWIG